MSNNIGNFECGKGLPIKENPYTYLTTKMNENELKAQTHFIFGPGIGTKYPINGLLSLPFSLLEIRAVCIKIQ